MKHDGVNSRALGRTGRWGLAAALSLMAALALSSSRADAQIRERKPVSWLVTVTHRIDARQYMSRMSGAEVAAAGRSFVFNITSGILVDGQGHVVTRLVNLDPTAATHDIKVTTPTGRILDAEFVGLDQPTGLVVLRVAGLRGAAAVPAVERTVAEGDRVSVVTAEFKIRQPPPGVERVALYPTLRANPGKVSASSMSPAYALGGVVAHVECPTLTASGDLSAVEVGGAVLGILKYTAVGHGDLLPIPFVRDVVARRILAAKGNVSSGWLGAVGVSLSAVPEPRRPAGVADGVLIQTITTDSPAASAGLKLNDVVVRYEDLAVRNIEDLSVAVGATPAGTQIDLVVFREGGQVVLTPTLGARSLAPTLPSLRGYSEREKLRAQVSQLYDSLRRQKSDAERTRIRTQLDELERRLAEMERESAPPR